jgi:hypothetical protein
MDLVGISNEFRPLRRDQSDRVTLSHEELSLLLGGIDLMRARRKNWGPEVTET